MKKNEGERWTRMLAWILLQAITDNPGGAGLYSKRFCNSWSEAGLDKDSKAPRKDDKDGGLIIGTPSHFYSLNICSKI